MAWYEDVGVGVGVCVCVCVATSFIFPINWELDILLHGKDWCIHTKEPQSRKQKKKLYKNYSAPMASCIKAMTQ